MIKRETVKTKRRCQNTSLWQEIGGAFIWQKMEVFLYNSNVCRLCGEENDNGTLLYSSEENNQNLSEVINTYLPIKVYQSFYCDLY